MYCQNCGSYIEEGRTYCPSCGEKVRKKGFSLSNIRLFNKGTSSANTAKWPKQIRKATIALVLSIIFPIIGIFVAFFCFIKSLLLRCPKAILISFVALVIASCIIGFAAFRLYNSGALDQLVEIFNSATQSSCILL